MKACSKCGVAKAPIEFGVKSAARDGRRPECRACQRADAALYRNAHAAEIAQKRAARGPATEYYRLYRAANRDACAAKERAWREKNRKHVREYMAAYGREWHAANRERLKPIRKAYQQKFARENPQVIAGYAAARRARLLRATPAGANIELITAYYTMAAWLTQETGVPHHVDHREPLQGKHVCGLHNEFNLQVLPARVNIAKSNRPSDVVGLR